MGSGAAALPPEAILQDDICAEMFTRNIQFFGLEAQTRIAKSFVVVVGLGGVGSHCANFLLRYASRAAPRRAPALHAAPAIGKLNLTEQPACTLQPARGHNTPQGASHHRGTLGYTFT